MHKQSRQWSVSAFCMVYLHHYDQQVAMANVQGSLHPKSLGRNDCLLALWERINCQAQARQSAPKQLHRWEDRKPQLTLTFLICVSLASQSFFKLEILIKDTNASNLDSDLYLSSAWFTYTIKASKWLWQGLEYAEVTPPKEPQEKWLLSNSVEQDLPPASNKAFSSYAATQLVN